MKCLFDDEGIINALDKKAKVKEKGWTEMAYIVGKSVQIAWFWPYFIEKI